MLCEFIGGDCVCHYIALFLAGHLKTFTGDMHALQTVLQAGAGTIGIAVLIGLCGEECDLSVKLA